jgi:hypothetical protein
VNIAGRIASRTARRIGGKDGKGEWRDEVTGCWRSVMIRDGRDILLRGYDGRLWSGLGGPLFINVTGRRTGGCRKAGSAIEIGRHIGQIILR